MSTFKFKFCFVFLICRYVFARPAGKRCFVVSSNGTTVSRLRNGSMLHHFPSALPSGARTKDSSGSAQSYSILDCIFHEVYIYIYIYIYTWISKVWIAMHFFLFTFKLVKLKFVYICSYLNSSLSTDTSFGVLYHVYTRHGCPSHV